MLATYYELAFQDITQFPACPKISGGPQCVQSNKEFVPEINAPLGMINDTWYLQCATIPFKVPLYFNITEDPGFFLGWSPVKAGDDKIWPDTVVDYKLTPDGKGYEWIIEFQCNMVDDGSEINFTALNFYARHYNVTEKYYDELLQAGYDAGLGIYMDSNFGIYRPPFDDCRGDHFTDKNQEEFDWYPEPEVRTLQKKILLLFLFHSSSSVVSSLVL